MIGEPVQLVALFEYAGSTIYRYIWSDLNSSDKCITQ